ncbi:DUF2235 domain-containing protein [Pseudoruegeria sp. SHC-113]|nr:DUF2235 domain-containing protein [Pseudoruegeria sp. SHC-113]
MNDRLRRWLGLSPPVRQAPLRRVRGPVDHVIIIDGTMSSLKPGCETNAGLLYKLLASLPPDPGLSLYYDTGIQWVNWRTTGDVIQGKGTNRKIRQAYGFLASRYRPGDRIFLLGYSRGAFAVRSLAGIIDRIGLLTPQQATVRQIRQAYRHYERAPDSDAAQIFARLYCHEACQIEMVGVWDTVKALGLRVPLLWRLTEQQHAFHNHKLGASIRHGYQALAMDETREAFAPVLWDCPPGFKGDVQQVWFRGAHGDVGGQLGGYDAARPLANIPLVWMLERLEGHGVALPADWRARFPCDPAAPSVGMNRGWGKMFLARRRRTIGQDVSESIHPTAEAHVPKAKAKIVLALPGGAGAVQHDAGG